MKGKKLINSEVQLTESEGEIVRKIISIYRQDKELSYAQFSDINKLMDENNIPIHEAIFATTTIDEITKEELQSLEEEEIANEAEMIYEVLKIIANESTSFPVILDDNNLIFSDMSLRDFEGFLWSIAQISAVASVENVDKKDENLSENFESTFSETNETNETDLLAKISFYNLCSSLITKIVNHCNYKNKKLTD